MQIGDFIEATNSATDAQAVVDLYTAAVAARGFDAMMYVTISADPQGGDHCRASTFPVDWMARYVERGYRALDPLLRYGALQRTAFSWSDLAARHRFDKAERTIMAEAGDAGLRDGVAVPLYGPAGELMGVSLASQTDVPDTPHLLSELHVMTVQFHVTHSALTAPANRRPVAVLTAREREVLQWVACGKSNWVIGEILAISEHGVDYHLRNILRKLGADSRITAVVKGLTQGVITL